jgi:hypothetical protein
MRSFPAKRVRVRSKGVKKCKRRLHPLPEIRQTAKANEQTAAVIFSGANHQTPCKQLPI